MRRGRAVAARAQRLARLASGARHRGGARATRAAARCLPRPRPAADRRGGVRLSVRPARCGANRRLAGGQALSLASRRRQAPRHPVATGVDHGRGSVRGAAVGRPRRGASALDRAAFDRARPAARRDVPRHPAHDAVPAARAAQPSARRLSRARPRAAAVACAASRRRRRNGHPPPPVPPALRASHAAAVPRVLPGDSCRARSRARRTGGANGRGRRARRSMGIARAGPAIRCCPTPTGRRSARRPSDWGRSSSAAAGMRRGRGISASCRRGAPAQRCRSRSDWRRRRRPHRVPARAAVFADPRRLVSGYAMPR